MDASRARLALSLVDLTNLSSDCTAADVVALCGRAAEHGTAAVCVWPDFVDLAAAELAGSPVRVATVVNFPTGDERSHAVGVITERAIADGADDIDVVLPYRALLAGDRRHCAELVDTVVAAAGGKTVKVILETGELPDLDAVAAAARLAIDHGADFIKTSTGKTPVSATPEAVEVMLDVIALADRPVGIKPSGGISSAEAAGRYLDMAEPVLGSLDPTTFRFGASGVLDALVAVAEGRPSGDSIGY